MGSPTPTHFYKIPPMTPLNRSGYPDRDLAGYGLILRENITHEKGDKPQDPGEGGHWVLFYRHGRTGIRRPAYLAEIPVGKNVRQEVPASGCGWTVKRSLGEPGWNTPAHQNRNHFIMTSASSPFA